MKLLAWLKYILPVAMLAFIEFLRESLASEKIKSQISDTDLKELEAKDAIKDSFGNKPDDVVIEEFLAKPDPDDKPKPN